MGLPNFLCVGAQKAGTTSLYHILQQHPQIYLPTPKEIQFFDQPENYQRGIDWYKKFFDVSNHHYKAIGEVTPSYMYYSEVPERIYQVLGPEVKLVFILRHPVDRAFSHYTMNRRGGFEDRPFLKALEQEPLDKLPTKATRTRVAYIKRGWYAQQVKRYLRYFDKRNMCFIIFEKLFKEKRSEELQPLIKLLGLKNHSLTLDVYSNPTRVPQNKLLKKIYQKDSLLRKWRKFIIPSKKVRQLITRWVTKKPEKPQKKVKKQLLEHYFMDDIYALEKIIGRRLAVWYD